MTKRTRWLGLVLMLAISMALLTPEQSFALPVGAPKTGMVCTPGPTFNLAANKGYIQTPDGNSVFMWSYANINDPDPNLSQFQSPGPVLCVTQGQTVTINFTNNLPEPSSIVFPGQDTQVTATGGAPGLFTTEAAANGGTASYSFVAGTPGTYIYESGSNISKQVEMGLYGALIVRPSVGANYAYDGTTQFDPSREYLLLLSEVDPDLHHAVELNTTYNFNSLHNRYFAVNGRQFPDSLQDNGSALLPNQPYGALVRIQPTVPGSLPSLIRMINVGTLNHPFHPHGNHMTEIAQDGRLLLDSGGDSASTERFGETIGSGQTQDYMIRWDDPDHWDPTSNPLPVAQPSYLNLTFKGNDTWYSGNPYLGYKGTLPTGTNSLNICGEWYFPFHSHALNEFANYDEPFGGMATLLRVDPAGGCFTFPSSTALSGSLLKSGTFSALGVDDASYYQVNPKTTTRTSATTAAQTSITVASAAGFPASGNYYVRIDNEVMLVTAGQGTTTWIVSRAQLGTAAATHANSAVVTAQVTDWFATFSGVPLGSQNFKVTYKGENCGTTTASTCTAIPALPAANLPQQTVKVCNWTVSGATGCSTPTSNGWATLTAPPAQPQSVGSSDVNSTWTLPGSVNNYIGTGSYKGQVRVLIHSAASSAAPSSTTRTSATTAGQTSITVASATGFPTSGSYYVRIDNEILQVTGGQGTTTWTVLRGQLGTTAATHTNGAAIVGPLLPTFSTWGNFMKLVYDAP